MKQGTYLKLNYYRQNPEKVKFWGDLQDGW